MHELDADAQEKPHEEGDRFQALLEAAPVAIVVTDQDGEIVLINAEAERLFGYRREELVGKHVEVLVPGSQRRRHRQHRKRFASGPRVRRIGSGMDLIALRGDGSEFPVEIGLGQLETEDGLMIAAVITDISVRTRALEAAQALAAIVESSDDAIIGKTLAGTITSWNTGAELIYGYAAAEAIGRHISMLCPSSEQVRELAAILEHVAGGSGVKHLETVRRRKDGRVIDVALTISPIRDGTRGQVIGASTVARDISERRRAAEALAQAEERFRGAFEGAPIGMALVSLQAELTTVNEALCRITGYSAGQLARLGLAALLHPDEVEQFLVELEGLRTGERTLYASELRLVHASGHSIWVALQMTVIPGRDGSSRTILAQVQDVTDRKRYEDRLQDLADHDSLTGLLNRRSFTRELDSHAVRVARYGAQGALLMLDLDHFKYVNDSLGHQKGDQILIRAAELLAGRLRESDVLGRLGGDEFAVLLPRADARTAERVAQGLLEVLRESETTIPGSGPRPISASIGVAAFEPGLSGEDVLVNADLAMYDAKEAGRNRLAVYRGGEHERGRMKGKLSWVQRIHDALDRERFALVAQPIVDYSTGRIAQHELLLRMKDDRGDLIPPGAFVYVAERLDIVQQIDAWVVRRAIELLDRTASADEPLSLSVNLSGRSLGDPNLLELIERELHRTGIAPERLTFEITETAAVRHTTHARRFTERLAELGCRVALDDFGAGFGSFYYLKYLTFDYLKIDGEFVTGCRASATDRLVIEALVGIARGLGKRTIAEFVGDEETVRILTRLGVDYGQGFHHGAPAPISWECQRCRG